MEQKKTLHKISKINTNKTLKVFFTYLCFNDKVLCRLLNLLSEYQCVIKVFLNRKLSELNQNEKKKRK